MDDGSVVDTDLAVLGFWFRFRSGAGSPPDHGSRLSLTTDTSKTTRSKPTARLRPPSSEKRFELFDGLPKNATKEVWIFRDYARIPIIKAIRNFP
jgi:hypothetical protein